MNDKKPLADASGFFVDLSVLAEPGQEILGLLPLGIAEDLFRRAHLADDALVHVYHVAADVPGDSHPLLLAAGDLPGSGVDIAQILVTVRRMFSDGPAAKDQAGFHGFGGFPFPIRRLPGLAGEY